MRWWSVHPASLVTSVDLSMFRDLEFSDFADADQHIVPAGGTDGLYLTLKERVAESAEWCVRVKMHPASLASPSAHARSSSLRRPRRIELEAFATAAHSAGHIPSCPKGSRPLTSSASTLTIISVVFTRLRQLRNVSGTDRQHVQDGVVRFPLPCQGHQTLLGEWAQRWYRWLRTSRWSSAGMHSDQDERSFSNHRQGVYPHTPCLGLILCASSESVKFEISGGIYSSHSCVSFPLGTSSSSPSGTTVCRFVRSSCSATSSFLSPWF